MKFEWDSEKAAENLRKHGVSFEDGRAVFDDPISLNLFDEHHSELEVRFNIIGSTEIGILFVTYTVRENEIIRIINARPATGYEKGKYYEE